MTASAPLDGRRAAPTATFPAAGGVVGAALRARDWSGFPLGPAAEWPDALKANLDLILNSPESMFVTWGPELLFFCNDAYLPVLGRQPADSIGRPIRETKSDLWEQVRPIVAQALAGQASRFSDLPLMMTRAGARQRTWWSFSYSPIYDGAAVAGMLCIANETTARVLADIAMRENETRNRQVLDAVDHAIIATDRQGRITRWNKGAERLFGWIEAEMLDEHGDRLFLPQERIGGRALIERRLRELDGGGDDRWYLRKGGERLWASREVAPLTAADGSVSGFVVVLRDRTEEHLAALALHEARRRLELTLSNAQIIGTWDWDVATNRVCADERFARFYSLPVADARDGVPASMLEESLHPADRTRVVQETKAALRTGIPFISEYRLRQGDGSVRHVLARGRCTLALDGSPTRFPGVVIDVTELRHAEETLRITQRAGGIGSFEIHPAPRTVEVSEEFARIFGLPRAGIWHASDLVSMVMPEDRARLAMVAGRIDEAALGPTEYRVTRPSDGAVRWIARSGQAIDEGGDRRLLGVVQDITERKRTELALQELNETLEIRIAERTRELQLSAEQLRQSQKMEALGHLTGGIAHDFNNLLTGIIGGLDLIRRRVEAGRTGEVDRLMEAATASAQRAAALTHRLLAFARRQSLDPKPLDVNRLVGAMEDLLHGTLGEQVTLTTLPSAGLWPALADANQLESAILNLAINARDAMPAGGRLTIETANAVLDDSMGGEAVPGDYVMIRVSDTGTGMTPSVLARAFDPFFTTKPIGQGTGLGLSMIYGFAKQSAGHVRIESTPGQGATFRLYLPRAAEAEAAAARDAPETPRGRGETVLVVEDDATVRLLVMEVLDELGYHHVEAPDAAAAIPILQSPRRIDLLVTDVGLPNMNGRQLAEIARQARPGLRVLFITGYAENAAVRSGFLEPGMEMLAKPFALDAMGAKVREMIER